MAVSGFSLVALAVVCAQTIPLAWASWRCARHLIEPARQVTRLATAGLVWMLAVVGILQVCGFAGLFSRVPVLLASLGVAAVLGVAFRAPHAADGASAEDAAAAAAVAAEVASTTIAGAGAGPAPDAPGGDASATAGPPAAGSDADAGATSDSLPARLVTPALVLLAVFAGVTALVSALVKPSSASDTLNYHLPVIVGWIQEHSLWGIRQFQLSVFPGGYPMNAQLLGAWFVLPFGRDNLVNLAPLAQSVFALVAIAALGEELGLRRRDAVLAGMTALFVPILATSNIGSLGSDLLPFAGIALSIVFVLRWRRHERSADAWLGALALGLAAGSKMTVLAYVAPLALTWVVLAVRRRRWLVAFAIVPLGVAVPAVMWYVRNLVTAHNPLWGFAFLWFPGGYIRAGTGDEYSVWKYLLTALPGSIVTVAIDYAAGFLGATALLLVGIRPFWRGLTTGAPAAAFDRTRLWLLGGVGLLGLALTWALPFTGYADGYNVPASGRYVAVTIGIWLAVLASAAFRGTRATAWRIGFLAAAAAGCGVSYLSPLLPSFAMAWTGIAAGVLAAAAAAVWLGVRGRIAWRPPAVAVAAAVTCAVVALAVLAAPKWRANWYTEGGTEALTKLYRAVQDRNLHGVRIAVAGIDTGYPLANYDLSNEVGFVGKGRAQAPWEPADREAWLAALRAGCYRYVAVFDDPEQWLSPVGEVEFAQADAAGGASAGLDPIVAGETTFSVARASRWGKGDRRWYGLYAVRGLPASCSAR